MKRTIHYHENVSTFECCSSTYDGILYASHAQYQYGTSTCTRYHGTSRRLYSKMMTNSAQDSLLLLRHLFGLSLKTFLISSFAASSPLISDFVSRPDVGKLCVFRRKFFTRAVCNCLTFRRRGCLVFFRLV